MRRTITKTINGKVVVPDIGLDKVKTIMVEFEKVKTERQITQFLFDNREFFGDMTFAFSEKPILDKDGTLA